MELEQHSANFLSFKPLQANLFSQAYVLRESSAERIGKLLYNITHADSRKVRRKIQRLKEITILDNKMKDTSKTCLMKAFKLRNKLLSKGLKFVPTPNTNKKTQRRQLMQDFNEFERRMRFQFTFANEKKEPHPFHVKSNLETADYTPGVTQSVAISLES